MKRKNIEEANILMEKRSRPGIRKKNQLLRTQQKRTD